MLVAHLDGVRVEASVALKSNIFRCPGCGEPVILKQGHVVVHHFAHYPGSRCAFGTGETIAHQQAKAVMAASLRKRGWRTEVEYVPPDNPGRRIDVITWPPHISRGFVFEFQHTPITPEAIFQRADDYAELGYVQAWIPFWKPDLIDVVEGRPFPKYVAAPFERWIQGFNKGKGLWYFDTKTELFRFARLEAHRWEDEEGDYEGYSKRWRTLELIVSCKADELLFKTEQRNDYTAAYHHWPRCVRGVIYIDTPAGLIKPKASVPGWLLEQAQVDAGLAIGPIDIGSHAWRRIKDVFDVLSHCSVGAREAMLDWAASQMVCLVAEGKIRGMMGREAFLAAVTNMNNNDGKYTTEDFQHRIDDAFADARRARKSLKEFKSSFAFPLMAV